MHTSRPDIELQWGRALSSAETQHLARTWPTCTPFNGAALFRARRPDATWATQDVLLPFNGAALFRARRPSRIKNRTPCDRKPSMGPRSFERGDLALSGYVFLNQASLQWGRALSSAETNTTETHSSMGNSRFNGAALFRARRLAWGQKNYRKPRPFNGAALFRARRLGDQRPLFRGQDRPSMGPRSFERGDHPAARLDRCDD